jgi:hypothetical protein
MSNPKHDQWMTVLNPNLDPLFKQSRSAAPPVSMALPEEYDYPFPMPADCKIVHGKIRGPANHALCAKHGHVVDTKTRMVIAKNVTEYNKSVHMEEFVLDKNSPDDATAIAVSNAHDQAASDHAADLKRYHDVASVVVKAIDTNTTKYSVCVMKACQAFQSNTAPLLKELKDTEDEHLFADVVDFALGFVVGPLGKKVAKGLEEIEKKVVEEVTKIVEKELKKGMKVVLEKKPGVEALQKAVQAMVDQANTSADHIAKIAEENIRAPLQEIAVTAGKPENLSDDQEKTIKAFLDQDYDSVLEGCGLPSAKTSEAIQLKVFGGLMQKFHEKLIVQKRLDDDLDSGDPRAVAYDAKKHADEAVKDRQGEIDKEERVH